MSRYRAILTTPGVAILFVSTTLARIPFGINGIAVLLFLREVSGSFAIAGLGTGALALGAGLGAPLAARLIDRRGVNLLVPLAVLHAGGLLTLWALGEAGAPNGLLVATAALIGTSFPPSGAVLRSRWARIFDDQELVTSAYALDAVIVELSFITGPLITATIIAISGPGSALAVSAVFVLVGTLLFLARFPAHLHGAPEGGVGGMLGALGVPAVRIVALTTIPVGFCIGAIEVAIPALAHAEGKDELSGVLLAIWSAGSAIGGLAFGARLLTGELSASYVWVALAVPLACLPLALATSPLMAAPLAILAGLPIAPLISSRNQVLAVVAPGANATEAFTWLTTALVAGLAAGSAVAGAVVETQDWTAAVLVGAAIGFAGAGLSLFGRRALVPAAALG